MTISVEDRLERLRIAVQSAPPIISGDSEQRIVFLSFSDGVARAGVVIGRGSDADAAFQQARRQLPDRAETLRWLRLDWVIAFHQTDWQRLADRLSRTKRGYFRLGIALDPCFRHAFLETELNANACLYGGPRQPCAVVNEANFVRYAKTRHRLRSIDFSADASVWTFTTMGVFIEEDGVLHRLEPPGRNSGRRRVGTLEPAVLEDMIAAGATFLAREVGDDGRFVYGWHPCFDRPIAAYNALRHASTTYAMLEAWEVTREPVLMASIERALAYLRSNLIRPATLPDGTAAAFLVEADGEIKLGGAAVSILALAKYAQLTDSAADRELLDRLGLGILHMQDPTNGSFVHVLDHPSLRVRQAFRIIYYDGEAAFALMRLYDLTGAPRWLDAVERAFEHFIAAGHAKAHDHWLAYAADALTRHRPDARYFQFGIDTFRDYLGFVANRITTFPTLLELMTASERLVARLRADPARSHLLDSVDLPAFYQAMHSRAAYLLNGHFWPELAMFYANPARIEGSFFIRHHAFRVRIDDVEHYLSGLIAYRRYLLDRPARHETFAAERGWSARSVERATGGQWLDHPPQAWDAAGLSIVAASFRPGDMVVERSGEHLIGIAPERMAMLPVKPSAIVTTERCSSIPSEVPTLRVTDPNAAVLAMGQYARARLSGKVIGVTGSAGKTTLVAMLAHALATTGTVAQTRLNANLPAGIAWNLASIPWDTPHVVLEMAIGRMRQNSQLAQPHVAVFTNILPAHLEYHRDTATIARRKSAIFDGMAAGGTVVLNRDMAHFDMVRDRAAMLGLNIVSYGEAPDAMICLQSYCLQSGVVIARTPDGVVDYTLGARGRHMALNSLAVLATLFALGERVGPAVRSLAQFGSLAGRGAVFAVVLDERRITVIDDSYNANPGSMAAALRLLGETPGQRRVAVLGEMLELGPDAADYHSALAPIIIEHSIAQVHTIGDLYRGLGESLPPGCRGLHLADAGHLEQRLLPVLNDGDVLLIKGSHGSHLHRFAAKLRRLSIRRTDIRGRCAVLQESQ